jgi:site-specific DNA-methyltransferase (adenine-specific)
MTTQLHHGDCLEWLSEQPQDSLHGVVTDPPYGIEYEQPEDVHTTQGVWRVPPPNRKALPRFTELDSRDHARIQEFFSALAQHLHRVVVPGAHVFIATNPLLSHLVYVPLLQAGFEKRGEVVRLVQTLRGGDRPKNAETEFPMVTVMPRSAWEPWGVFRKPCCGTVAENLRRYGTGALRRISEQRPFTDVISSGITPPAERAIAPHPSLKPQAFLRDLVRAVLPLETGTVLDPFAGSGSTLAAAEALGLDCVGTEKDPVFFGMALQAIPQLAAICTDHQISDWSAFFSV